MSAADVARRVADQFDAEAIPYAIGGALALGVWGAPRTTVAVDISAFVDSADLPRVIEALERAGVMVDATQAARDVARIGMFRARFGRTPVDVYISGHPHFDEMSRRKQVVADPDGKPRWFLSREDLAILKLFYGRAKDLLDVERLFAVKRDLDIGYIRDWLRKMVPAGDRRLDVLADLERRFGD